MTSNLSVQTGNRQPSRLGEVSLHRTLAPGPDRAWADCLGASADGRWDLPDPQRGRAGGTRRFLALLKTDPPSLQLNTMEVQRVQWRIRSSPTHVPLCIWRRTSRHV